MIEYKVKKIKNTKTQKTYYFAAIAQSGVVTRSELISKIEKRSSVSSADTKACLDALEYELKMALANGHSVRLGDLGSFRPTIKAFKGNADKNEVKVSDILRVRVVFTPSTTINKLLRGVNTSSSSVKMTKKV